MYDFCHVFLFCCNSNILLDNSRARLTVTCEVWSGHVLDGDLLQEGWLLTARVSTHHPGLLQPLTQPGQVTVAHIWVGQEITVKDKNTSSTSSATTHLRWDEHWFRNFLNSHFWVLLIKKKNLDHMHFQHLNHFKTCTPDRGKFQFIKRFYESLSDCYDKSTWMRYNQIYFSCETCIIMWILQKSRRLCEKENKKERLSAVFIHLAEYTRDGEGEKVKVA